MLSEKTLQSLILAEFGALSWLKLWRNNTGQSWTGNQVIKAAGTMTLKLNPGDICIRKARPIRFGLPGSADIFGVQEGGRFTTIEVKTETGRQSQQQKNFQNMVQTMGGVYVLARSVEDVYRGLGIIE